MSMYHIHCSRYTYNHLVTCNYTYYNACTSIPYALSYGGSVLEHTIPSTEGVPEPSGRSRQRGVAQSASGDRGFRLSLLREDDSR